MLLVATILILLRTNHEDLRSGDSNHNNHRCRPPVGGNRDAAWKIASSRKCDIMDDLSVLGIHVMGELVKGQPLPDGWKEDFYPYAWDDEKTIGEIWEGQ